MHDVHMVKKSVVYYEKKESINTEETLKLAYDRAKELGVSDIIIATTHGSTGLRAAEVFKESHFNLVAVSICEGWKEEGWPMTSEERDKLLARNVKVHTGIHALGDDVGSAFTGKWGGMSSSEVVRETLYRFCQGMKVCVEITLMASDAGLIPMNKEVIAIAGIDKGADTAIVLNSACPRKFLDLKIKEIIAKPREG